MSNQTAGMSRKEQIDFANAKPRAEEHTAGPLSDKQLGQHSSITIKELVGERDALVAQNRELVEALAVATGKLWGALGGSDDKENRARADRICAPFSTLLAKHGR